MTKFPYHTFVGVIGKDESVFPMTYGTRVARLKKALRWNGKKMMRRVGGFCHALADSKYRKNSLINYFLRG